MGEDDWLEAAYEDRFGYPEDDAQDNPWDREPEPGWDDDVPVQE